MKRSTAKPCWSSTLRLEALERRYLLTASVPDIGQSAPSLQDEAAAAVVSDAALSVISTVVSQQTVSSPELFIEQGSMWAYLDDGSDQSSTWSQPGFVDSSWLVKPAQFGYGEADEATVVSFGPDENNKTITTYFRREFEVADPATLEKLYLDLLRDDGAVVYVNGQEVLRSNMAPGSVDYDTRALLKASGTNEATFFRYAIEPSVLVSGTNLVAVELHQYDPTSSDASFDLQLTGTLIGSSLNSTVTIDFDAEVDPASVEAGDLLIDGVLPAVAFQILDADTVEFTLPQVGGGTHEMTIAAGAIEDTNHDPIDAFVDQYSLDFAPQYDVKHTPYLQPGNAPLGAATDQIDILWQTIPGGAGIEDDFQVSYRLKGSADPWTLVPSIFQLDTGVEDRINHVASIVQLDYDTEYEYQVVHRRATVTVATYADDFRTRLAPGDNSDFTFVAYGDSAYEFGNAGFAAVQNRINLVDPDFSLLLGDNAYQSGTHSEFDARLDPALIPEATQYNSSHVDYFSFGNHDIGNSCCGEASEDNYSSPIPVAGLTSIVEPPETERREHNYSFDYGNVHFVTLDTNSLYDDSRLDALVDWVVADLAASTAKWKIVFGHYPISGAPDKPERPSDHYFQQVVSEFREADVDLFLAGHSHTFSWTYPLLGTENDEATYISDQDQDYADGAGLVQVISGVGGRSLRNGTYGQFPFVATGFSQSTATKSENGFAQIDVTEDELTVSYVSASGDVIDSFTLSPDVEPPVVKLVAPEDGGRTDRDSADNAVRTLQASEIVVQLIDFGLGVDDGTVSAASVNVSLNGNALTEGVDYLFTYDSAADRISLTPATTSLFPIGSYSIEVSPIGDTIEDVIANEMPTVMLSVEFDNALAPLAGGLIESTLDGGIIAAPGETKTFQLDLDAGQTLSVAVYPETSLQPSLLLSPPGAVVSASTPGQATGFQTFPISASGTYTLEVAGLGGSTGRFAIQTVLNAALEAEPLTSVANDNWFSAQNLAASFLPLPIGAGDRGAVVGALAGTEEDWYRFTLSDGQTTTLALSTLLSSSPTLELYDQNLTLLATSISTPTLAAVIADLRDATSDLLDTTYYAKVSGTDQNYSMVIMRDAHFELGFSGAASSPQDISPLGLVLGHVDTETDVYAFEPLGGFALLSTATPLDGPNDLVNLLDPQLDFYDPDGQLIVSNDNGAGDGRNASITQMGLTSGVHQIYVSDAGATGGDYVLLNQGSMVLPSFFATGTNIVEGSLVPALPTQLTVNFNRQVRLDTLQAGDLSVNGQPAVGLTMIDGDTAVFDLATPPVPVGNGVQIVEIAQGSITGVLGTPIDTFLTHFEVDAVPLFEPKGIAGPVSPLLDEASGLVASRRNSNVLWAHNDSVGGTELFAMTGTGDHLGTYDLAPAANIDWEDIAIGPGPTAGVDYLYVGDLGDGEGARSSIVIHRVPEPTVSDVQPVVNVVLAGVESIGLSYPAGTHNAEALMVDPWNGDLYIVTDAGELYGASFPQTDGDTLQLLGNLTWAGARAADISPSGLDIFVKSLGNVFHYSRPLGLSLAEALVDVTPGIVRYEVEPKGEAITFDPATGGYFTLSEGADQSLRFYAPNESIPQESVTMFQSGAYPQVAYDGMHDTTLLEETPNSNEGTEEVAKSDGESGNDALEALALLRWDLSDIPADVEVREVALNFNVTSDTEMEGLFLYAVSRDWVEDEATWNSFATGSPWQLPGGYGPLDRDATALAFIAPMDGDGSYTFELNDAGRAVVQSWIETPSSNHGFALVHNNNTDGLKFESHEVPTFYTRPKLLLRHRAPDTLPPTVRNVVVNGGNGGLSSINASTGGIRTIDVIFSEPVLFDPADLVIEAIPSGEGDAASVVLTPNAIVRVGSDRVRIEVADPGNVTNTWVQVTIGEGGGVTDLSENHLDGEAPASGSGRGYLYDETVDLPSGDGTAGGGGIFFVGHLSGDANGDKTVDAGDLGALFAVPNGESPSDYDENGRVDAVDLAHLLAAWGTSLDDLPANLVSPDAAIEQIASANLETAQIAAEVDTYFQSLGTEVGPSPLPPLIDSPRRSPRRTLRRLVQTLEVSSDGLHRRIARRSATADPHEPSPESEVFHRRGAERRRR
jgi:hypothetical protein